MSRCPNVQRCDECEQLLIHKGTRLAHESASELGQIVHDKLPHEFTWIDIDGAIWRRSIGLLRIIEHKSPGQHKKPAQQELLKMLARIIEHIKICPDARGHFPLHEFSGGYLIESDIQEGNQLGPSKITRLHDGDSFDIQDEFTMLCWLAQFKKKYVREKISRQR